MYDVTGYLHLFGLLNDKSICMLHYALRKSLSCAKPFEVFFSMDAKL